MRLFSLRRLVFLLALYFGIVTLLITFDLDMPDLEVLYRWQYTLTA